MTNDNYGDDDCICTVGEYEEMLDKIDAQAETITQLTEHLKTALDRLDQMDEHTARVWRKEWLGISEKE